MKCLFAIPLLLCALTVPNGLGTTWAWLSAQQYVEQSALIAVVDIKDIHEAVTPEGILVRSAEAEVVKPFYWRFEADMPLPKAIVIYHVDPNAVISQGVVESGVFTNFKKGRMLALLEMNGLHKFKPYDRLSIQEPDANGKVVWPTVSPKTEPVPLEEVEAQIAAIVKSRKTTPN